MSANNQIVLIGRVGNNPREDVRKLQSGSQVVEVRLAVNRPGKDPQGNSVTDWVACQFWNKQADTMLQYVEKGDLLSVSGSLRVDNWEKDGERRQKYFVHGEGFQMLTSRAEKQERQGGHRSDPATASSSVRAKAPAGHYQSDSEFALDDDELPPF